MRKLIPFALLLLLVFGVIGEAQWRPFPPPPPPTANLSGIWYLNGNPEAQCQIIQREPGRALFINEHGSQAWGSIRGDDIWIPDWSNGVSDGLRGRIRGNRIFWVGGGSFWSR